MDYRDEILKLLEDGGNQNPAFAMPGYAVMVWPRLGGDIAGRSLATLENMARNKKMMEDEGKGRDDFYHMKASCEAGQSGLVEAVASQILGGIKEDLKNNWKGVTLGLVSPEVQCRILVNDYLKAHGGVK